MFFSMFKLNECYEIDRRILKCGYIRYSPAETSAINTPNSQIFINIPREDLVITLLNSYPELILTLSKNQINLDMETVMIKD